MKLGKYEINNIYNEDSYEAIKKIIVISVKQKMYQASKHRSVCPKYRAIKKI